MRFYGRTRELTQLKKLISSDDMLMGLIYGRRRIGKSELVKQAIKESGVNYPDLKKSELRRAFGSF